MDAYRDMKDAKECCAYRTCGTISCGGEIYTVVFLVAPTLRQFVVYPVVLFFVLRAELFSWLAWYGTINSIEYPSKTLRGTKSEIPGSMVSTRTGTDACFHRAE